MASRQTTLTAAAASLVVGLVLVVAGAPSRAQSPATAAEAAPSTTQPPAATDFDTSFWVLVRDSKDPDAFQSYLQSFPAGKFAEEARQKLTALRSELDKSAVRTPGVELTKTDPSSPPSGPPPVAPSAGDNKDLARALQRELKRVGCLEGEADGVWGEKSRTALKSFARHANLSLTGDEPNVAALDAASAKRTRVCPLVCDDGEKVVGDRCVPVTQKKPARARQEQAEERKPRRTYEQRPAAQARESSNPNSGKRLCFGARPNELVTCP
jgi:peptidoglycan hydrolase-like protein with peptidoglycan-binding domain